MTSNTYGNPIHIRRAWLALTLIGPRTAKRSLASPSGTQRNHATPGETQRPRSGVAKQWRLTCSSRGKRSTEVASWGFLAAEVTHDQQRTCRDLWRPTDSIRPQHHPLSKPPGHERADRAVVCSAWDARVDITTTSGNPLQPSAAEVGTHPEVVLVRQWPVAEGRPPQLAQRLPLSKIRYFNPGFEESTGRVGLSVGQQCTCPLQHH